MFERLDSLLSADRRSGGFDGSVSSRLRAVFLANVTAHRLKQGLKTG